MNEIEAAKAELLDELAERFRQRSDTYFSTMEGMAGTGEYSTDDIIRYGAYAAEAQTTATHLRVRARQVRAGR